MNVFHRTELPGSRLMRCLMGNTKHLNALMNHWRKWNARKKKCLNIEWRIKYWAVKTRKNPIRISFFFQHNKRLASTNSSTQLEYAVRSWYLAMTDHSLQSHSLPPPNLSERRQFQFKIIENDIVPLLNYHLKSSACAECTNWYRSYSRGVSNFIWIDVINKNG